MNTNTAAQHGATAADHSNDLTWVKKAGTYTRFDGMTITKTNNGWGVFNMAGQRIEFGYNLSFAKFLAVDLAA